MTEKEAISKNKLPYKFVQWSGINSSGYPATSSRIYPKFMTQYGYFLTDDWKAVEVAQGEYHYVRADGLPGAGTIMTKEVAHVIEHITDTWRNREGFLWDYRVKMEYSTQWVDTGVYTAHYGKSTCADYAYFNVVKQYLSQHTDFEENEDWTVMYMGMECYILFIKAYDEEAGTVTPIARWWLHSELYEYDSEDLCRKGDTICPTKVDEPEDVESLMSRICIDDAVTEEMGVLQEEQYVESLRRCDHIDTFWSLEVDISEVSDDKLMDVINRFALWDPQQYTNEYPVKCEDRDHEHLNFWIGPLLGAYVEALPEEIDEEEVIEGLRDLYDNDTYIDEIKDDFIKYLKAVSSLDITNFRKLTPISIEIKLLYATLWPYSLYDADGSKAWFFATKFRAEDANYVSSTLTKVINND